MSKLKYLERWPFITGLVVVIMVLNLVLNISQTSAPDFAAISDVKEKKTQFFSFVHEQTEFVNEKIIVDRKKLLALKSSLNLSYSQSRFITKLARDYRVISDKTSQLSEPQIINELLIRVDFIPPALLLAQAANESAWGTSRFATRANNYFGIWCFTSGCGLVPLQRSQNQSHEVRYFPSVKDSIYYYVKLLNSSAAYSELRAIRGSLREQGLTITAKSLLPGLKNYSERGEAYTNDLLGMIKSNNLEERFPIQEL